MRVKSFQNISNLLYSCQLDLFQLNNKSLFPVAYDIAIRFTFTWMTEHLHRHVARISSIIWGLQKDNVIVASGWMANADPF